MKQSLVSGLFGLLGLAAANLSMASIQHPFFGDAYAPDSERLVYVEEHRLVGDQHQVIYKQPDGKVFARKRLIYGSNPLVPSFEQENQWSGELIQVIGAERQQLNALYREVLGADVRRAQLPITENTVVDAGFDFFVKRHWNALLNGQVKELTYIVPSRLDEVRLRASQVACDTPDWVCFEIRPKQWWLSVLIDPLRVSYERNTRRLMRFQGKSNIANQQGEYLNVDIRYRYP